MTAALSRSVEDYLKAIYQLTEGAGDAGTTEIALRLELTPASVTGMVKRMAESGLLTHEPYRGVRLTAQGKAGALAVMRRHRILETYLITKLGYDWSSVHQEAERLEHAVSDELIDRMAEALDEPRYDPHGAPIPTRDGRIERPRYERLADMEAGARVVLRQVGDDDSERLRYLEALGIMPMVELEVLDKAPFGGPVTLKVEGEQPGERVIGIELAGHLLVERR